MLSVVYTKEKLYSDDARAVLNFIQENLIIFQSKHAPKRVIPLAKLYLLKLCKNPNDKQNEEGKMNMHKVMAKYLEGNEKSIGKAASHISKICAKLLGFKRSNPK